MSDFDLSKINPFPHTTNLQQTTLKMSWQKFEKFQRMRVELLNRVENNVVK